MLEGASNTQIALCIAAPWIGIAIGAIIMWATGGTDD